MMDYARFLSRTALRRQPSPIRALQPLVSRPGMISLGGGMPNPSLFPFTGISLEVAGGHRLQATAADVREALQYSPTPGLPELVSRLSRMQQGEHAPAAQVSTIVVPGSQDGLAKLFDALLEEGDALLVEEPTYSGSLAYLQGKGCALVGVPTDAGGIDVAALRRVLGSWDSAARGGKRRPRVLYTIPTGSNPTGASQSEARKRELLAVAREFDLLLIEDDPYYYLQYAPTRARSLLALDTDGRVVRTDSFSKILSAGLRVGTVTGPTPLIERVNLHNQASILHTSGLSQLATLLLLRHWRVGEPAASARPGSALGAEFEAHLQSVCAFYTSQCEALMASAAAHLRDDAGAPLATWTRPSAGMFVWFKLLGERDTSALIMTEAAERKVLMVPGAAFFPAGAPPTPYARAAFSTATHAEMETAMARLGELLRERRRKDLS